MKLWLLLGLIGLASARAKGRLEEENSCEIPIVGEPDTRCTEEFRRWAFNTTSQQCERFVLTGCKIMPYLDKLYDSKHDCMSSCDKSNPLLQAEAPPTDFCFFPPTKGIIQCMAYIPKWTFDVSAAEGPRCVKYIYGGCLGTKNLFSNEKDCLAGCGDAITKISQQCPVRDGITSCDKFCSGDRDCDAGEVCCPSHDSKCGAQCVPAVSSSQGENNASLITIEERTMLRLKTREICEQPIRQGPCFAAIRKFAFKPEKNRCEVFLYGGCQGNDNNFDSASECQMTCGGDIPNDDLACADVRCDSESTRQYKDRNCIPQYTKGACCPTSYYCEDTSEIAFAEPETQVCIYKGQSYEIGANITAVANDDPCFACQCTPSPIPLPPSMTCLIQTCPPLQDSPSAECIIFTTPGKCCPEWKCEERASLATCQANNQTYQEGDVFNVTPCRRCICTANYTDENGYGCSDEVCLPQPPSPNCVPVYETGVCCHVDFHCPTNETTAVSSTPKPVTVAFRPTFNQSDCLLPSRVGRCKASFLRYYYDPATQKCKSFYYGGCSGNANRFETQWECEKACAGMTHKMDISTRALPSSETKTVDVCQQPKDVGPCRGYVPSFYYDSAKGACESFLFGGCKGNGNRFETKQDCLKLCVKPSGKSDQSSEICSLQLVEGPCRAQKRRYFFNATSQQCESFNYGGCRGNDNNFVTLALCEAQCKPKVEAEARTIVDTVDHRVLLRSNPEVSATEAPTTTSTSAPDFCSLPVDVGPCRGHKPRYFHDSVTGQCRQFIFGGCKGNRNNFGTQEECESACRPEVPPALPVDSRRNNILIPVLGREQCKLAKDTGPCRMAAPRFFFNSQTGKCEAFTYGGCDGNANNYLTAEECEVRCGRGISRKEFDEIMGHRRPDQEHGTHTASRARPAILQDTSRSHCALPADPGFCLAFKPRFYYNSETEKCERFIYGGCRGNANNFRTEQQCLDSCGSQNSRKVRLAEESVCRFGNITLNRGDQLPANDQCLDCTCETPPDLTCRRIACAIQPRKAFIPTSPTDRPQSVGDDNEDKDDSKKESGEDDDQDKVAKKKNSGEESDKEDDDD